MAKNKMTLKESTKSKKASISTNATPSLNEKDCGKRLEEIRTQIDEIDEQIVKLLDKRASFSKEVGAIKKIIQMPVFRPDREKLLLDSLLKIARKNMPDEHLLAIYNEILSSSRAIQEPLRISFLGPIGTFSHMAATEYFGTSTSYIPMNHMADVFSAVVNGVCDFGVIPLENSLHGTVVQSVDLFAQHNVWIQGEWLSRIALCLMSQESKLEDIKVVYSHSQPLGQSATWLRQNLPNARQESVSSTAHAAEKALNEKHAAAIGHSGLAERLQLSILAKNIEDMDDNWTRFCVIGSKLNSGKGNNKTSVLFTVPDKPGSLAEVLDLLAAANVNMNKLESRPVPSERWKYMFFTDLAVDLTQPEYSVLLELLRKHCHTFRIIGSYPSGKKVKVK